MMTSVINVEILDQLKEILADDFVLVLDSFLEEGDQIVKKMDAAMNAGDINLVREAAHAMKSMSGNVGAMELSELADQLQVAAANAQTTTVSELCPAFQEQYQIAAEEVRSLR